MPLAHLWLYPTTRRVDRTLLLATPRKAHGGDSSKWGSFPDPMGARLMLY